MDSHLERTGETSKVLFFFITVENSILKNLKFHFVFDFEEIGDLMVSLKRKNVILSFYVKDLVTENAKT
jgi:hypothetical protein